METLVSQKDSDLHEQRLETIKNYIRYLGEGKHRDIIRLFSDDGIATSSSNETLGARHFYERLFFETISSISTNLISIFPEAKDANQMVAYFDFSWTNRRDGKYRLEKFLDLIVFEASTAKIKALYVFANSSRVSIMQQ